EKMNVRDIAELMYGKRHYGPNVIRWMDKFGIERRSNSEAVALQWEDNVSRRKMQSTFMKTHLREGTKAREKLIAVMQSEEYRKKQSESKMGKKNGMWNPNLTEADRMDRAGKAMNRRWVTGVKKRDNNTCVICSASYATMVAHHLNGYHWD